MKVKLLSIILCSLLLTGCGNNSAEPDEPEYDTYTVNFSAFDLGSTNLLQSSDPTFEPKVTSFFNDSTYEGLLKGIAFTGNNKVKIEKSEFAGDFEQVQGLILGSQSSEGQIQFNFYRRVASVKLSVQQYYNITPISYDPYVYPYYDGTEDYSGYIKVEVNNVLHDVDAINYRFNDEGTYAYCDIPPIKEISAEINDFCLDIKNFAGNRTRLYSMELKFEK